MLKYLKDIVFNSDMVDFELHDYKTVIRWFELCFGKNPEALGMDDKKTFWKLSFLCEDKINYDKEHHVHDN
jgi:hypothetical protein